MFSFTCEKTFESSFLQGNEKVNFSGVFMFCNVHMNNVGKNTKYDGLYICICIA